MSRIVNIGDFYRTQTSTPSVIQSLQSSGLFVNFTSTYFIVGDGVIDSCVSGTTGPIDIHTFSFPPNIGHSVSFNNSDIRYAVSGTGSTGDFYYFTISQPFIGEGIIGEYTYCSIYSPDNIYQINNIIVHTPSSGDTLITTWQYPLTGIYNKIIIGSSGGTGSSIVNGIGIPGGDRFFIEEPLDQDYTGTRVYIQRELITTQLKYDPTSSGNAHAKRQFGNHPRRQ